MNKGELVNRVSECNKISKRLAARVIDCIFDSIISDVSAGNKVKIVNFGAFEPRERKAKRGVNPQEPTQRIDIEGKTVPVFSAGKKFKQEVWEQNKK